MSWRLYEHKVLDKLKQIYPDAKFSFNTSIKRVKSERSRQIDILFKNRIDNIQVTTVVDAKYFKKKIDIKTIESFIGFLSDVEADRGILVTEMGYTKSAIKRIQNDSFPIELKILTMDELPNFVGFKAIMNFGPIDCYFETPPKWIVNSKNPTIDILAKIHPNKYDWNTAIANNTYMYGNIYAYLEEDGTIPKTINWNDIDKNIQDTLFKKHQTLNAIEVSPFVKVDGEPTMLLECELSDFSEFLAVLHYDFYTIFFGLITPIDEKEKNLDVLKYTVSQTQTIHSTIPLFPSPSRFFLNYERENNVNLTDFSEE